MSSTNANLNKSILIVDDDLVEIKALRIGLGFEGFEVTGVSGGHAALDHLQEKTFSLALIDMMMPGMNGLELARTIRTIRPRLPTILMSAYHLSPVQLVRADTGAVGFVPKPFDFDELVRFIRRKLGIGSQRADQWKRRGRRGRLGLSAPFDVPETIG